MSIQVRSRKSLYHSDARATQKSETKTRLVDAAEQWFGEHGYEDVSVTEIAKTAGVVPSLINTYFMGKAGLLLAVLERHNAPQFAAIAEAAEQGGTALARLDRVVGVIAAMDMRRARLMAALQALSWSWPAEAEARHIESLAPVRDTLATIMRDGIADGALRDIPVDHAVETILSVITTGLRPAVFASATSDDCAERIRAILRSLLAQRPGAVPPAA